MPVISLMMALTELSDNFDIDGEVTETPMSRTHQYRKVMKPMLERKRRARINKCLDELKDLMVHALQTEGESITKLEKADVLELTVRHLQKLKRQQMLTLNPHMEQDRYHAGYTACATEVSRCLSTVPGVDITLSSRMMSHLGQKLTTLDNTRVTPLTVRVPVPQYHQLPKLSSPTSDSDLGYNSGRDSTPSPNSYSGTSPNPLPPHTESQYKKEPESVWRPF